MKYKIGFIGAGVMASAMIDRMLNSKEFSSNEVCAIDLSPERKEWLNEKKIYQAKDTQEIIDESEIVILAVKPQYYSDILLNTNTSNLKCLLSIMAGVKISTMQSKISNNQVGIARVMPNTPIAIGEGVCAVCYYNVAENQREIIEKILNVCGTMIEIEENKFDAVTSISGSGPAYVYLFLNGLVMGGIKGGLSFEESKKLATATLIGAAKLSEQSDLPYDGLVDKVCSKGGTTIEAINLFKSNNLEQIIAKGVDVCREKSRKLSENN